MVQTNLKRAIGIAFICTLFAGSAPSASVTYTGSLGGDDQVQEFIWTLTQSSAVTLMTDSYGGGTLGGVTIPAGGFVPVISIFSGINGNVIASDGADGTCSAGMQRDSSTHMCDDAVMNLNLAAGSYILAVTEFFNVPVGPNLSNGFLEQGQGNFTGPTCGTTGSFFQTDIAPCVQRTGNFALTASTVTSVPEPATLWLALPLLALGLARRKRRSQLFA